MAWVLPGVGVPDCDVAGPECGGVGADEGSWFAGVVGGEVGGVCVGEDVGGTPGAGCVWAG